MWFFFGWDFFSSMLINTQYDELKNCEILIYVLLGVVVVVAFVFYLFLHSKEFHDGIQCDLFDWILNTFQIPFTCVTWFLKIDDDFTMFSL